MKNLLEVSLKMEAGSLVFSLVGADRREGVFDFNVTCSLVKKFSSFLTGNFACRFYRSDIERLVYYFENHVQGLMDETLSESPTYVPLEGDVQIKGLDGGVVDLTDGYFSINILFNCGKVSQASSSTYFGLETVVEVSDINDFTEGLNKLLL